MLKRTHLLFLLFFSLSLIKGYSQAPAWTWAKEAYTANSEFAKDVAVDPLTGDVVVVGDFTGDISAFYGPGFAGALGGGFVAKYNSSGTLLWAFKIGDNDNDRCNAVAIDVSGNIYVAGYLTLSCDFKGLSAGPNVLNSTGGKDAFLAKYSSAGMYQWAKKGGGVSGDDEAHSVCVNSTSVFITGYYKLNASFGALSTFSAENKENVFVVSYNLSGNELWLADAGTTSDGRGYDIAANNTDVYLSGDYKGILKIFNSSGVLSATSVASGNFEGFVINYTTGGNFVWFDQLVGSGESHANSCVLQGTDLFITGSFDNSTSFPGYAFNPVTPVGSGQDFYVASLKATTGATQWVKCESGSSDQVGQQIEVDGNSNVVVAGFLSNDITFAGGPTLTSAGNLDVFVVNYSLTGTFNWVLQGGGSDNEVPHGIACPPGLADIYVAGEYKAAATFGSTTLFNQNDQNIFVAKIGCPPVSNNTITANQTICAGQVPAGLSGSLPTGPPSFAYLWQQSPDNVIWAAAAGTNNLQNYAPPAMVSSSYYRRVVSGTGACAGTSNNSASVLITVNQSPTTAAAGPDQTSLCGVTSTTLAGNTPVVGTGLWTVVSGAGGSFVLASNPTTAFNGLAGTAYVLRWTVSNSPCTSSTDDVNITFNLNPSAAAAGPDQSTLCGVTSTTLAATAPSVGTGSWSVLSGVGGTVLSPSSPSSSFTGLAGNSYTLRWTVSNGPCAASTDDMIVTFNQNPTTSAAGGDQNVCSSFTTLAGNTPAVGTGIWTLVSGAGTVTAPGSASSTVTGLGLGANIFRWTISNAPCASSFDDVVITQDTPPTAAAAGPDQSVCGSTSVFAGNTPLVGSGLWTLISGSGTVTTPTSPSSAVTGLGVGSNTFRWTISNGSCTASSDDVTIISSLPITANAGADQLICAVATSLAATTPAIGSGMWTLISGTGTITSPTSANSGLTALGAGANVFRWTVTNGVCSSSDDVTITRSAPPTTSAAGPDQTSLCGVTSTTLAANTPAVGTGAWSIISGAGGSFVSTTSPTTTFNGLAGTAYVLRWTISNAPCTASADDVNITFNLNPTVSNAGPDQTSLCGVTSTTLAANTPTVGTGAWSIISGAGGSFVSATNPTTTFNGVAGTAYVLRWTISNAPCSASTDNVNITFNQNPTVSNAGPDQTSLCGVTSATLAANTPTVGTGVWSIISGTGGSFVSVTNPTTTFNGVAGTAYVLRWTISNAPCTASTDNVNITFNQNPTVSNAGPDQTSLCGVTSTTLAANTPAVGTGSWSIISGAGGSFVSATNPTTTFNGVAGTAYVLRWTISNAPCTASTDDVNITFNLNPTVSNAGPDQTSLCGVTSTTLAANTPTVGTGAWSIISGAGGSFVSTTNPTTTFNGVAGTAYVLRWTISNAPCTASTDNVNITFNLNPTVSNAGLDQTSLCGVTSTTLAANTPTVGTGAWSIISGAGGSFVSATNPTTTFNGVAGTTYVLRWTISNAPCTASTDNVNITFNQNPTVSNAGLDQTSLCGVTSTTLAANTPTVGTGAWSIISGAGGSFVSTTSPTTTFNGVAGTAYVLRWTISNAPCTASTDNVNITFNLNPTVSNAGPDQTSLCGVTSTTLAANTPTVGTGAWSIISGAGGSFVSTTNPTTTFNGVAGTAYVLRWTISNAPCTASTDNVNITFNQNPTISNAGPDQTSLCGVTSTTLAANTPAVGTGAWSIISGTGGSFVSTTNPTTTFNGVAGTTYVLRWTISNAPCTASTDDVNITFNQNPTVSNAGPDQTSLCGVTSTTLAANTPTVGTGAWSIISGAGGSFVSTTNPTTTFNGVAGTAYVLRWTISNAPCTASADDVNINFNQNPTVSNAGNDSTFCSTTSMLNGNAPMIGTGSWSVLSGTGIIASPSSASTAVSNLSVGMNKFVWTISNAPCTALSDTITCTVDPFPTTANAGSDSTICASSSVLSANTPSIGTGLWTIIAGASTISNPSNATTAVTGLSIGTNTFVWTISNGTCNSTTDTVNIFVDAFPTAANAGSDSTICSSSSVLTANTPSIGTGLWTVIAGASTVSSPSNSTTSVNGLSIGTNTFVWTISNGTCNSTTDTVNIFADAFPTAANAGFDSTICSSSSVLNANTPSIGSGLWTVVAGASTISNPSNVTSVVTGLTIGTNTFVWTISNGACNSTTDTVNIFVDAFPTAANAGSDSTICSSSSVLSANTPSIGTGLWTVIAGASTVSSPSNATTIVNGLSIGTNTFVWTISNGTCNSTTDTVNIFVDAFPTAANAGFDSTICASSSVLSANTPSIGTGLWTIIAGTSTVSNPSNVTTAVTGLSIGTNSFVWTISNGTCNSTTDTVNVFVDAFPTAANAGSDSTICSSSSALSANTPSVGTGLWTVIAGASAISNPLNSTTAINGLSIGTNTFVWTITNGTCNSTSDTVNIIVDAFPTTANAGYDSTICSTSSTLNANIPSVGTGLWTVVAGSGTIAVPSNFSTSVSGLSPGSNKFRWTISNLSCPPSFDEVEIWVDEPPTVASCGPDFTTYNSIVNLSGNTPSVGAGTWSLVSGSGTFTNINDPFTAVSGLNAGLNNYQWTISNGVCPSTSDEISITLLPMTLPNGFSPNGDNVNDRFEIQGLSEFKNVSINVFNRWGNLVYSNADYQNDWGGNNTDGSELSDDTYYYTLELNRDQLIKGFVVIKRK